MIPQYRFNIATHKHPRLRVRRFRATFLLRLHLCAFLMLFACNIVTVDSLAKPQKITKKSDQGLTVDRV